MVQHPLMKSEADLCRREALPPLDEKVKSIKLRNAIEQQFAGSGGVYRQTNIEKRRVYNLPQWREVCESTDHQPPAKRGEVRQAGHKLEKRKPLPKKQSPKKVKATDTPGADTVSSPAPTTASPKPAKTKAGKKTDSPTSANRICDNCATTQSPVWRKNNVGTTLCNACGLYFLKRGSARPVPRIENQPPQSIPAAPESTVQLPSPEQSSAEEPPVEKVTVPVTNAMDETQIADDTAVKAEICATPMDVDPPTELPEPITTQSSSTTPPHSPQPLKRKRSQLANEERSDSPAIISTDFLNFDYRIHNSSEYTVERCHELERIYWKTIMFNSPMYGADMPGSLFDDSTDVWNVAKLDNMLCRIGKTIPGVNSAYLYLGMWKATFSWHVEVLSHLLPFSNFLMLTYSRIWISIQLIIFILEPRNNGIQSTNATAKNSKQ